MMFNWLKNVITPSVNPELKELYEVARDAKQKHDKALDEFQTAVDRMMKRMDRAHRITDHIQAVSDSKRRDNDATFTGHNV
jgi:tRNA A37 methylthiotransferase MiaB